MIIIGLDNGFYVRGVKKLPRKIYDGWKGIETDGDIELAYWRKCWGIRDEILWTLGADHQGGGDYLVSREKLKEIIEVLKKFTNKEYWEDNADSIWEYDEFKDNQKQNIKQLRWIYGYMKWHPDVQLFFYDSY